MNKIGNFILQGATGKGGSGGNLDSRPRVPAFRVVMAEG